MNFTFRSQMTGSFAFFQNFLINHTDDRTFCIFPQINLFWYKFKSIKNNYFSVINLIGFIQIFIKNHLLGRVVHLLVLVISASTSCPYKVLEILLESLVLSSALVAKTEKKSFSFFQTFTVNNLVMLRCCYVGSCLDWMMRTATDLLLRYDSNFF